MFHDLSWDVEKNYLQMPIDLKNAGGRVSKIVLFYFVLLNFNFNCLSFFYYIIFLNKSICYLLNYHNNNVKKYQ